MLNILRGTRSPRARLSPAVATNCRSHRPGSAFVTVLPRPQLESFLGNTLSSLAAVETWLPDSHEKLLRPRICSPGRGAGRNAVYHNPTNSRLHFSASEGTNPA